MRFFVLAKAHQADCGNALPTTYMGHARDVYEEGALIFPAVKVQRDYKDIDDIVRMCRMRIRVPEQWWGQMPSMCMCIASGNWRQVRRPALRARPAPWRRYLPRCAHR